LQRKISDRKRPRHQERKDDPARVDANFESHQFEESNPASEHLGDPGNWMHAVCRYFRDRDLRPAVTVPRRFRLRAACFACCESARWDAAARGSRFSALRRAVDRFDDVPVDDVRLDDVLEDLPLAPRFKSCCALRRVAADVRPFFGGASFTPARRAFDNPIAIACFVDRAPCFPCLM